jgi:hypothetical protein
MKPFYALLICVILSGCAVLAPPPTATPTNVPTSTATLTPTPDLTATAKANTAATQTQFVENARATGTQKAIPTITAVAHTADILTQIMDAAAESGDVDVDFSKAKRVFGPAADSLVQKIDKYVETYHADVELENFIVSITFVNPYDTSTTGNWDYGVIFRSAKDVTQYRLVVLSNQTWSMIDHNKKRYIDSNASQSITRNKDEENTIWLIVSGEKAYFFINGVYMKSANISEVAKGDIMAATGIFYGNAEAKTETKFRDFIIWSLP